MRLKCQSAFFILIFLFVSVQIFSADLKLVSSFKLDSGTSQFRMLNSDQYVYYGWFRPDGGLPGNFGYNYLDLADCKIKPLTFNLMNFWNKYKPSEKNDIPYPDLIFYDKGLSLSILSFQNKDLLCWDNRSNRPKWAFDMTGSMSVGYAVYLGSDPSNKFIYFANMCKHGQDSNIPGFFNSIEFVEFFKIEAATGKIEKFHETNIKPRTENHGMGALNFHHNDDFTAFVIVEYNEYTEETFNPPISLYYFDTRNNREFDMPVFQTAYGLFFDKDGKVLIVTSNMLGKIQKINLESGKVEQEIKCVRKIHHIYEAPDQNTLYLFATNKIIELRDRKSLKLLKTITVSKLLPGESYALPEGMIYSPRFGLILLPGFEIAADNSSKVYLLKAE